MESDKKLDKVQQKNLLENLKIVARRRVQLNRHFSEFTGLIGELEACSNFNYTWNPCPRYDAEDDKGRKIQIKSRRLQSSLNLKGGTLGRFGSARNSEDPEDDYCGFDRGILVVLDYNFKLHDVWELDNCKIEELEDERNAVQKKSDKIIKLSGLTLSKFIKDSEQKIHKSYEQAYECLIATYPSNYPWN